MAPDWSDALLGHAMQAPPRGTPGISTSYPLTWYGHTDPLEGGRSLRAGPPSTTATAGVVDGDAALAAGYELSSEEPGSYTVPRWAPPTGGINMLSKLGDVWASSTKEESYIS